MKSLFTARSFLIIHCASLCEATATFISRFFFSYYMEVLDFDVEKEPEWITVKVKDGTTLKVKVEIIGVFRMDNDPNTGLPIYGVQVTSAVRLVSVPKELMQKSTTAMPQYR